ncbi:hypothetical protein E2C01_038184 [Portunus trituberculatus]|uniref:Uncharacterized protein n=1 Tax=Portunus trituberculatus TaxID=210409 RepID=A0A5B7FBJ5_PORTR|nr:hypothetical protein [Portunus trituberculatus]
MYDSDGDGGDDDAGGGGDISDRICDGAADGITSSGGERPEGFRYSPTIPSPPTTAPMPKSVNTEASNSGARGSGKPLSRVINIKVPEEMQDLAVLEISMKTNGDISLSGGHDTGFASHADC